MSDTEALIESLPGHPAEIDESHPDNQPVTVGEQVWYTLQPRTNYEGQLEDRVAFVAKVWSSNGQGCCNLVVLVDGTNDVDGCSNGTYWATSRCYSKEPMRDHWHR